MNSNILRITLIGLFIICSLLALSSLLGLTINMLWLSTSQPGTGNDWTREVHVKHKLLHREKDEPTLAYIARKKTTSDLDRELVVKNKHGGDGSYQFTKQRSESSNVKYIRTEKQCDIKHSAEKFDCFPQVNVTEKSCEDRGCCWRVDGSRRKPLMYNNDDDTLAPVDVPYCFYPRNHPSYNVNYINDTKLGFNMDLSGQPPTYYPRGVHRLAVDVLFETNHRLHVKVGIHEPLQPLGMAI